MELDQAARRALIAEHHEYGQKVARSLCRRYKLPPPMIEDALSAGMVGLCEAGKTFDPGRGVSFTTFSYHHISGKMRDFIRRSVRLDRVKFSKQIDFEQGTGIEVRQVPVEWGAGQECDLVDTRAIPVEELLIQRERRQEVLNAAAELPGLEGEVFRRRLAGEGIAKMAKSLGYSRCHLSRVAATAIDKVTSGKVVRRRRTETRRQWKIRAAAARVAPRRAEPRRPMNELIEYETPVTVEPSSSPEGARAELLAVRERLVADLKAIDRALELLGPGRVKPPAATPEPQPATDPFYDTMRSVIAELPKRFTKSELRARMEKRIGYRVGVELTYWLRMHGRTGAIQLVSSGGRGRAAVTVYEKIEAVTATR